MFLSRRAAQAEYFDTERPPAETIEFYKELGRVNRLFLFAHPFQWFIPRMISPDEVRSLSILDLGAGDGLLGEKLTRWAADRGWAWKVTNLDNRFLALTLSTGTRNVAGSALALPFREASFDFVIASQMTHHFSDAETQLHLREAWRVTRRAILFSDLHRNPFLYGLLWLLFLVRDHPESLRRDGLLSVRRAWRMRELKRLANLAGISAARIHFYFGSRVLLKAIKPLDPPISSQPHNEAPFKELGL
jgi:Methyltransferase domain